MDSLTSPGAGLEGLAERIRMPKGLAPETATLVLRFAEALARKLHKAEKKYGHGTSWTDAGWEADCAEALIEHVQKGDPRDVAAYCAFMWHHGWKTSLEVTAYPHAKGAR